MTILIIEDEATIRTELTAFLQRYGYECIAPDQFDNILDVAKNTDCQLILLDITLPSYDGYYLCREIRKTSEVPIMIVTSRDSQADELMSMNLGADDFITKPYHPQILLARIGNLIKRSYGSHEKQQLSHNGLTLDVSKSVAAGSGGEVELTKNELRILLTLMKNCDRIVPRDELMDALWQSDAFVDDNTLTVNINRLRKKLSAIGMQDYLQTKRGQGYTL